MLTPIGSTWCTSMPEPEPRSSARIASVRPTTACLVAQYVAPPGNPPLPAIEASWTMCPRPRGRNRCSASFEPMMTPMTLTSTSLLVAGSASSTNGPTGMIPALLTSTSSGPRRLSTASRNSVKLAWSVTSSGRPIVSDPSSEAVRSASGPSMSPIATRAPLAISAAAVARPIPRPPPVIATTWPSSDRNVFAI